MLGSDVGAADMVIYARNSRAHTIVVDNSPFERYKAKREADEHAFISTNDIDALVDFGRDDLKLNGKTCGIISFATRGGTVGQILGLEETIERMNNIVEYENRYPVGSTAPTGRTLRQLLMRFIMVCNDEIEMKDSIKYLYDRVEVLNSEGESMIVKP